MKRLAHPRLNHCVKLASDVIPRYSEESGFSDEDARCFGVPQHDKRPCKYFISAVAIYLAFASAMMISIASVAAQETPQQVMRDARIDQEIGQPVSTDLSFFNEQGQAVHLGQYFGSKPSILVMAYFNCPDLCPMSLRHLVEGLNGIGQSAGKDFNVIVVSFDPSDTPAIAQSAKLDYVRGYRRGPSGAELGNGWHFLTGSQQSIAKLADEVGFHYTYDAASKSFAHAAGAFVLTTQGRVSHCFFGIDYIPAGLEGALNDAAMEHSSWVTQPQQQYCFAYNPLAGKTSRIITRIIQASGILTILLLGAYIAFHLGTTPAVSREAKP